jgi:AraC-like DNA-binding protein
MENLETQQRLKNLYKMLLELAIGNLSFRIHTDNNDDELNSITESLNDFADRLQIVIGKYDEKVLFHDFKTKIDSSNKEASELIFKVLEYIKNNLEEPLPTTKQLSKMFGTNEFTLKDNFRNIVKTSIYQYYTNQRLQKAHFLIINSTITLKEIALLCGFNDYPNFYKAFKKCFKYSPRELERK